MNRFSSGVWMQSTENVGGNGRGNDRFSFDSGRDSNGGMWNSRNDLRSDFSNDMYSRDTMRGSNGQGNNSFLSYLDQRNSQHAQINDSPALINNNSNQRFFSDRDRNWNAIDFTSDAIGLRDNIDDGIGMRNLPLLTPPNNGMNMRHQGSLLDGPRDDRRSWSNSRFDYNMSNETPSRRSFNESNESVKITILRKDVGSKIIGKNGMLIKDLEAKSHAEVKVSDKPGTDKAIVEIFGSMEDKALAVQLIIKKCGSSLDIDWPDHSKGTNNGSGNSRPSPFIQGNSYLNSGQGLLKSPLFPTPNTDLPYWKSQPKPLMAQKMPPVRSKNSFQNKGRGGLNQGQRFFNSKKNAKKPNSFLSNKNQTAGTKRPKNKSLKPNNGNANIDSNAQKGPSAKKAKRDLYSDADLAPEPQSLEGAATGVDSSVSWQNELKDLAQSLNKVRDDFIAPSLGPNYEQTWDKNSKNVVEHFGAGSFETGIQLLRKQQGIVNFEPFKQLAMSAFICSKLRINVTPELPTLIISTRLQTKEGENTSSQPINIFQLSNLLKRLQHGYSFTTSGKFSEAIEVFRDILYAIPFLIAVDKAEIAKIRKLGIICREYITGLTLEITRLQLPKVTIDDQKRICELAAYFTRCNLQSSHRMLTLSTALNLFFKLKNFKTAASFAQRLLELEPSADMVPQLTKIVEVCNTNLVDEHELNYEDCKTFVFCSQTLKRIKLGDQDFKCPFCYVRCAVECKGQICKVCTVAEIGKDIHSEAK